MAGHSQFKNIMHRKGAQDVKRSKLFTKLLREIHVAAKIAPDPEHNPRLRTAILAAREANVPKDKIQNTIAKASNPTEGDNFEEIRYEGYAPGGIAIIVEALSDNRNRTASEVRSSFTKYGGTLGETGSVSFLFKHIGSISYPSSVASFEQIFEATIEAGADDCTNENNTYEIICSLDNFHNVRDFLDKKFGPTISAEITWRPNASQLLSIEEGEKLLKMLDALDECDDVQNVFGNFELPDALLQKLKHD
jgi:YebC/PmpR family DNA-binding regulatory protein